MKLCWGIQPSMRRPRRHQPGSGLRRAGSLAISLRCERQGVEALRVVRYNTPSKFGLYRHVHPAISPVDSDKNQIDSPAPSGTFARYLDCLARVSLFLFRRRYLAARDKSLSASSPYSLQGPSEKIQFDSLVCQYPLKSQNLLAQYKFAGTSN